MSLRLVVSVAAAALVCAACSRPLGPAVTIAPDTDAAAAPPSASAAQATAPPTPAPSARAQSARPAGVTQSDEDDLREATFRHMFGKNASGLQHRAQVLCLQFENRADPPAAFVARFASSKVPVVPVSRCEETGNGVVERSTGAHGLSFRIDSIAWIDRDHATIGGGYFEAGLSASGNIYTLERKSGAWVVTKDVMQWIS